MLRRRHLSFAVLIGMLLTLLVPVQPAAAQSGPDYVKFWDDAGIDLNALPFFNYVADPATLTDFHYLNPTGGRTTSDGLLTIVGNGRYQVVRDRDWQIYNKRYDQGSMMWLVSLALGSEKVCISPAALPSALDGTHLCRTDSSGANGVTVTDARWDTVTLTNKSDSSVKMTMSKVLTGTTVTLEVTSSYDIAKPQFINLNAKLTVTGSAAGTVSNLKLFLGNDMYLDSDDYGAGVYVDWAGKKVIGQVGTTSVGGIRASGRAFDSYVSDDFTCFFGVHADCMSSVAGSRGPAYGERLPNLVNTDSNTDIGVGAQWDISGTSATIATQLVFVSLTDWQNPPPPEPEPTPEPGESSTPAVCNQPATLSIKPDPLEIAPGGAATVWVELSNPCRDLPTAPADALLSFSDGLSVIETSEGALNLGQRAALQRFSLAAGETRGWYAIVRAADPLPTAPLAVAEIYAGAAVVRSDELALTVPAVPAPVPVVEQPAAAPAEPAAPVEPAAPTTLPTTLPNTAGEQLPLTALLIGLLLLVGGLSFSTRRR